MSTKRPSLRRLKAALPVSWFCSAILNAHPLPRSRSRMWVKQEAFVFVRHTAWNNFRSWQSLVWSVFRGISGQQGSESTMSFPNSVEASDVRRNSHGRTGLFFETFSYKQKTATFRLSSLLFCFWMTLGLTGTTEKKNLEVREWSPAGMVCEMHKRGSSNLLWVQVSPSCFRHGGMVKVSFLLSLRWSRSSLQVRNPTGCTTAGAWASRPTRLARHVASAWRSNVLCRQRCTSRNNNWESVDASVGYPLDSEMAFVKIMKLVTKMLLFYAFLLLKRCKNVENRQAQPAGLGYGLRTWDCSGYRGYWL